MAVGLPQSNLQTKNIQTCPSMNVFLGSGCKIEGTLKLVGPAELASHVKGSISAEGPVYILREAIIEGDINGNEIIVIGEVRGNITSSDTIKLESGARILGDITAPKISIEDGVYFEGRCKMGQNSN